MANPNRGEVSFDAGEKTYTLALQINEWAAIERKFDIASGRLIQEFMEFDKPEKVRFGVLRSLLWGCLRRHHREDFDDPDEVGALINVVGVVSAMNAVSSALAAAQPPKRGDEAAPNPPKQKRRP